MRYHNITKCDMKNGEGLRVVLWVSHCEHKCKGCQNPQTWNEHSGIDFDIHARKELYYELSKDYCSGITLSGGDPLSKLNRDEAGLLIKDIKFKFPTKDVWVYTGYRIEELKDYKFLKYIDVLVDGKFNYENRLKNPNVKFRGDDSQRIIDVKKSLKTREVILLE